MTYTWFDSKETQRLLKISGCELMHLRTSGEITFKKQGKQIPTAIYLHRTTIDFVLLSTLVNLIFDSIERLNITEPWNLLKLYKRDFKITLLNYPDFNTYAYPALHTSITIDIEEQTKRKANYQKSENPPILHRKETFVLANYPLIESFKAITAEGETIELYKNTKTIGFKQQWQKLIYCS